MGPSSKMTSVLIKREEGHTETKMSPDKDPDTWWEETQMEAEVSP